MRGLGDPRHGPLDRDLAAERRAAVEAKFDHVARAAAVDTIADAGGRSTVSKLARSHIGPAVTGHVVTVPRVSAGGLSHEAFNPRFIDDFVLAQTLNAMILDSRGRELSVTR